MKTIVILSGGMDSVTLLHKVVAEQGRENVRAISFDYGQVHKKELDMAEYQCEVLRVLHEIVNIENLNSLLPSTLTGQGDVPQGHYESESMKKTVVPFRNSIMSTIALGYAAGIKYEAIALGVHAGDHYIYPDCRPEFIAALSELARLGDFDPIQVYTPFLYLSKVEILEQGKALNVDYSHTWTSYSAGDTPDFKTGSSVERTQAFIANNMIDPLYKTPKQWEEAKAYALSVIKE